ncbi:MAG: hypothetical protein M1826_004611 [Phylliscum demangeonii]|nr:MAG: hypothetical protein M1826_004611 [Phylliscum demangeonii]
MAEKEENSSQVPDDGSSHRPLVERLKHPFSKLRQKAKDDHSKLHQLKIDLVQEKHKLGKLGNLFNPNHRHDEKHERETDERRTHISDQHRFRSFAPEREGNEVKWYVDGRDYCWAVSAALDRAKEIIYIADWWLSPELFLRRPPYYNQEWRLDQILKRKAEAGVQIFVMVYKEVERALTCNSLHTKEALHDLCPHGTPGHGNIHVMRHPDHNVLEHFGDMTFYWAHHEKFLVVDYNLAFIGGIDLCFGRWDSHQHPLADLHPEGAANEVWPGQDYNNNRIMDFQNVHEWTANALSKDEYGRMPWHDVAMGVIGACVYDIAEHFVLRWNFVKRDKYKRDPRFPWLTLQGREGRDEDLVGVQRPKYPVGGYLHHPLSPLDTKHLGPQGSVKAQVVRSSCDWSSGIIDEHSIQNAYIEVIRNARHYVYIENQFFITATGDQQAPVRNQIGQAIVEACVRAAKEGRKFRVIAIIPCIPGFAGDLRSSAAAGTRAVMDYQYKSICRGEHSIFSRIAAQGVDPRNHIFFFNLRSYDRINKTAAMVRQEELSGVKYQEVQRAHAEEIMGTGLGTKSAFRHGLHKLKELHDDDSGDHATEHRVDQKRKYGAKQEEAASSHDANGQSADSIAHHAMLLQGQVADEPWEGEPEAEKALFVQEELYVHAKLLIADDRVVICGSANLNDRSQLGIHDSELAIVMEDSRDLPSTMDGQSFTAGYHAATLRRQLWREHLGLLPPQRLDASDECNAQPPPHPDEAGCPNEVHEGAEFEFVADPLGDEVWETWMRQAKTNTDIYRRLFRADPDDAIKTFEDYDRFLPRSATRKEGHLFFQPEGEEPPLSAHETRLLLDGIRGHLVLMPMDFLCDAPMAEKGLAINSFTESIYT